MLSCLQAALQLGIRLGGDGHGIHASGCCDGYPKLHGGYQWRNAGSSGRKFPHSHSIVAGRFAGDVEATTRVNALDFVDNHGYEDPLPSRS